MSTSEVLWVGRVATAAGARWVQVQASGGAPAADDLLVAIDDPFADEAGEPYARVRASAGGAGLGRVGEARLLAPVRPSKVVCVGRNFRAHAAELGNEVPTEPLLFFKPPSCLVASGEPVTLPRGYERIDMEAELVVVIGRRATAIAATDAWQHVAGYTLGNDVSNRDLQKRDKQWTRAKGFDGFGPVGPWLRMSPPGAVLPAAALRIQGGLNGERKQDASLADMVFEVPFLLAYISACMTLMPGDIIFTGTPEGVCALRPGDVMTVELAGWELPPLVNPTR
ncbi:fumarylacetoacetate hydrolase family protein [Nannocystis sp.]|uniref:fumarylacetoacetate hydrolase family protein n=1 Tax=Nannocystis sp. TaxID=1962667 RepID=UPI002427DF91|nr:fumarylacetoacetate hydrolase family protein [Nannocystis sp.]MBK7826184.1 fumarylacetoacetate hydrolase family protein [Nannocystis sp.]MBK9758299.1 fumarylacetoacetate hydrolase family protein [Nannocystis sp.]